MNFRQFATSEFGTRLWLWLGRTMPQSTGHTVARGMAGMLSRRRNSALYSAIRANQAMVRGGAIDGPELDGAVRGVFQHASMALYDLSRLVALGDDAIRSSVTFEPEAWQHVTEARAGGQGIMLCGPHLSAFHLGIVAFALRDMPTEYLLAAEQPGGYAVVQQMVSRHQVRALQMSTRALREALRRLHSGGMVLTGVDWPEADGDTEELPFFGQPARLPTGHIRMAIAAGARLLCVATRWDPGTGYRILTAPPMDLELTGNRREDIRHNALRVLAVIERWIAERPEQWLMFRPVWHTC